MAMMDQSQNLWLIMPFEVNFEKFLSAELAPVVFVFVHFI